MGVIIIIYYERSEGKGKLERSVWRACCPSFVLLLKVSPRRNNNGVKEGIKGKEECNNRHISPLKRDDINEVYEGDNREGSLLSSDAITQVIDSLLSHPLSNQN